MLWLLLSEVETIKKETKDMSEYRTVKNILEDLAKAHQVVHKLEFELWRMYK